MIWVPPGYICGGELLGLAEVVVGGSCYGAGTFTGLYGDEDRERQPTQIELAQAELQVSFVVVHARQSKP